MVSKNKVRLIDYTKKKVGSVTAEGGEISICSICGRNGEYWPEGFNMSGSKAYRGYYIHLAIEDRTKSTLEVIDSCEIPWSPEAQEVVRWRASWEVKERRREHQEVNRTESKTVEAF